MVKESEIQIHVYVYGASPVATQETQVPSLGW